MKSWMSLVSVLCFGTVLGAADAVHAYSINTTETGRRIRWGLDSVALQLDPAFESFLPPGDAYAAIEIGMDAWRGLPRVPDLLVHPGAPHPKPGHHGKAPTNGVYLLEHWPYEKEKLAITVITYEMETGRLLDADILVNGETKFALLDEAANARAHSYDLAAVLTHETGHVLGLGESAADPDATMWPYATPGETQKRTLSDDDESGVIESYLSAPPAAASGCGPLTVAGRAHAPIWLALGACLLMCVVLRGRSSWRRKLVQLIPVAALLLIVGFREPLPAAVTTRSDLIRAMEDTNSEAARGLLAEAARDSDPEARVQVAEALARAGTRDDRALAEQLCSDADARIAARAHVTLGALLARAPRATIAANTIEARARLATLSGASQTLFRGRARHTATVVEDGLLFTEYAVRGDDGRETVLRVGGGSKDGIGQRVLDAELPPADDQDVVVAAQPDGSQRWAFHSDGRLFGGHLGDGPAIIGTL